ncbi:GXWXG domain-containing protein [Paracoccus everestensis]|uniref:GXWXG domain-containing protein n=1 Tax=Paracoccus everestensis TaxID=2903900 RepID=UPI001F35D83C|nr:GXWXG domain-containing protein [Paracoccus everestensis]
MTQLVQPRLVNPPDGDPGVYLDFRFGRRAVLFDLGSLEPLTPRELLRVSHVFVSHAHMDHVAGFDPLLRLRLNRPRPLTIIGPAGFVRQTESRLGAFSWNLLNATSVDFRLAVQEFDGQRLSAAAEFRARDGFRRRDLPPPVIGDGLVLAEDNLVVEAVALDHGGISTLAFALQESLRINVRRAALEELGVPVGPWLEIAKAAIRTGAPDEQRIAVPQKGEMPLGELRERVVHIEPGQRVAYVTDAADTVENRGRIISLARRADHLFIEAAFTDADSDRARVTAHLTARAAGEIARASGARRVIGFHYSARYAGSSERISAELAAALDPQAPREVIGEPNTEEEQPDWVEQWHSNGLSTERALARFDSLPGVEMEELTGTWRGSELPTGHPLDGLLERFGWQGKRFESKERVHPLIFHPGIALDPSRLPLSVALRWPRLARSIPARAGFAFVRRTLRARGPSASLARIEFRDCLSTAMIYDRQPIIDHFRRIDDSRLLGLMQVRSVPPYFFLLTAEK